MSPFPSFLAIVRALAMMPDRLGMTMEAGTDPTAGGVAPAGDYTSFLVRCRADRGDGRSSTGRRSHGQLRTPGASFAFEGPCRRAERVHAPRGGARGSVRGERGRVEVPADRIDPAGIAEHGNRGASRPVRRHPFIIGGGLSWDSAMEIERGARYVTSRWFDVPPPTLRGFYSCSNRS